MRTLIQHVSERPTSGDPFHTCVSSSTSHCHQTEEPSQERQAAVRRFQPLRFSIGLLCTASGAALVIGVGLRVVQMPNFGGDAEMPLMAICVLSAVLLLGSGFSVMATSSSGFDEDEFDRLACAGNISAVSRSERSDTEDDEIQGIPRTAA